MPDGIIRPPLLICDALEKLQGLIHIAERDIHIVKIRVTPIEPTQLGREVPMDRVETVDHVI